MRRKSNNRGEWLLNAFTVICLVATLTAATLTGYLLLYPQSIINPFPPPHDQRSTEARGAITTDIHSPAILEDPTPAPALGYSTLQPFTPGLDAEVEPLSSGNGTTQLSVGTPKPTEGSQVKETTTLRSKDSSVQPQGPATASPTVLPMSRSMPECDDHDPTAYHMLINEQANCHYDHAHGMPEPDWARPLFGDEIVDYIWTVSYPWETPEENVKKHAGYTMHAYDFRDFGCVVRNGVPSVVAYIAETHGAAIGVGKLARFHSFALAAELCNGQGSAGIIFTGGFEDYGQLTSPYKSNFVSYSKFVEQMYDVGMPPYVGEAKVDGPLHNETWNSAHRAGSEPYVNQHQIANIAFRIRDAVDYVDPNSRDSGDPIFVPFNEPWSDSSEHQLYQLEINVPDMNGDGSRVTGRFYADVHGNLAPDCLGPNENCVPLILKNAIPGSYGFNGNATGQIDSVFQADSFYEEDLWFCGNNICSPYSDGAVPSGWIDLAGFGSGQ